MVCSLFDINVLTESCLGKLAKYGRDDPMCMLAGKWIAKIPRQGVVYPLGHFANQEQVHLYECLVD